MTDCGDIIYKYLIGNGYDGLAGDECGCGIDDLMACDECNPECQPAFHYTLDNCPREFCGMRSECLGYGCYRTAKPEIEVAR